MLLGDGSLSELQRKGILFCQLSWLASEISHEDLKRLIRGSVDNTLRCAYSVTSEDRADGLKDEKREWRRHDLYL